jgi:hypothetical protein
MAFFPAWVYALICIGAVIAIIILLSKSRSIAGFAFLSLPIVGLINSSSLLITLENFGQTASIFGMFAYVGWPVIVVVLSVPLEHPWDTLIGIATVSLMELALLILLMIVVRRYVVAKPSIA